MNGEFKVELNRQTTRHARNNEATLESGAHSLAVSNCTPKNLSNQIFQNVQVSCRASEQALLNNCNRDTSSAAELTTTPDTNQCESTARDHS